MRRTEIEEREGKINGGRERRKERKEKKRQTDRQILNIHR